MSLRTWHVALVAVLGMVLTACPADDPAEDATDSVSLEASEFAFDPEEVSALAGEISFELANVGDAEHNLTIEDANGDVEVVADVDPGGTGTGTATLDAGTYTIYCSIPGHREAGQEGTLTVVDG